MSQGYDIHVIWEDAKARWLRPSEVHFILMNHESFDIASRPAQKPPSGSLFLYNRRVLRYFRKDGYLWRRKKDGKNVGEAHERLKVDNVDALSCYYAHGEQDPALQRRCYWMLDPAYDHIVLVHYRRVLEERQGLASSSNLSEDSSAVTHLDIELFNSGAGFSELNNSYQTYPYVDGTSCSYISLEDQEASNGDLNDSLGQHQKVSTENNSSVSNPVLNSALRKLVEQLSLEDEKDDGGRSPHEKEQPLVCGTSDETSGIEQTTTIHIKLSNDELERSISPSWTDLLVSTSGLPSTSNMYPEQFTGNKALPNHIDGNFHHQWFNIQDICPEWAVSSESSKVILIGDLFGNNADSRWAVMFGDIEVGAEIIRPGVLRCWTPEHYTGKVALRVTCGNGLACSDVREFEFRAKHTETTYTDSAYNFGSTEELQILAELVQMLLHDNTTLSCGELDDASHQFLKLQFPLGTNPAGEINTIVEQLLRSQLLHWLTSKRGSLSKDDQHVIHLISALGYNWALPLILNAGVGINFRDANGWAALHWAAYFGRETMVAHLLAAGASAMATTNPTQQDPAGKKASFLASARGYEGLAGYLSETELTSYLLSIDPGELEKCKPFAMVDSERILESASSFRDSLAAVRNATLAAARIQVAFRAYSFRKKQLRAAHVRDECGMTREDIDMIVAASRHLHSRFEKAAISIQKRFRGWKGRKNYVNLRNHVIRIQAHFRGYQVRKQCKSLIDAVSVLEKAVLRWRRRRAGLRGYHPESQPMLVDGGQDEDDQSFNQFRRQKVEEATGEAVSRVLCMANSPEGRHQYRRMRERYREATMAQANLRRDHNNMAAVDVGNFSGE